MHKIPGLRFYCKKKQKQTNIKPYVSEINSLLCVTKLINSCCFVVVHTTYLLLNSSVAHSWCNNTPVDIPCYILVGIHSLILIRASNVQLL